MTKTQETIDRAYGSIPKEVTPGFTLFDFIPSPRGIRYYWILLVRKFTR